MRCPASVEGRTQANVVRLLKVSTETTLELLSAAAASRGRKTMEGSLLTGWITGKSTKKEVLAE